MFVFIGIGPEEKMNEVDYTENTHQPVKPLKVIMIQVGTQKPWCMSKSSCDLVDGGHKNCAEEVPHGQ